MQFLQNLRCDGCDHGDNDRVGSCGGGRVGGHVDCGGGEDVRGSGQVGACGDGCDGCSAGSCGGSCRLQIRFSRLRM